MKPTVHTDLTLSISTPVQSNDENTGLMEAAYRLDDSMISRIKVIIVDNHGIEHEVSVHDWNVDVESMTYFGEDE